MIVLLGKYLAAATFIVCESLNDPEIISIYCLDRFVEAIRPNAELIKLDYGSTKPIFRSPLKQVTQNYPLPTTWKPPKLDGRDTPTVK